VGEIILNLQFYIPHIRPKSVTIGKKTFAASQAAILLTKEQQYRCKKISIPNLMKKNYAKMRFQHLHKTHMLSGVQ